MSIIGFMFVWCGSFEKKDHYIYLLQQTNISKSYILIKKKIIK